MRSRFMTAFSLLLACLFCFATPVEAAGPATHAFLAQRLFELHPDQYTAEEQEAFLVGTLFPDIRHLGVLTRDETHVPNVSLADVLAESNAFHAGILYHSYVDQTREDFALASGIYDTIGVYVSEEHRPLFTKLLEDTYVMDDNNLYYACNALDKIRQEELDYGLPAKIINKWHGILIMTLSMEPCSLLYMASMGGKGFLTASNEDVHYWLSIFDHVYNLNEVKTYNKTFFRYFDDLLTF